MKIIKSVLLILLAIIVVIGGNGCMNSVIGIDSCQEKTMKELEEYLNQKYDCVFSYSEPYGASMGSNKSQYLFDCDDFENEKILIETIDREDGSVDIFDNYLAYFYKNDTVGFIKEITDSIFEESVVFYNVATVSLPKELLKNSSLEDYLKNNNNTISPIIIVEHNDNSKENAEKLIEIFKNKNVNIDIRMFFVSSIEEIEINENNFEEYAGYTDWYIEKLLFLIDCNSDIVYEEWK